MKFKLTSDASEHTIVSIEPPICFGINEDGNSNQQVICEDGTWARNLGTIIQ